MSSVIEYPEGNLRALFQPAIFSGIKKPPIWRLYD
jgi:hypothetical protein